jgi:hypothetical protein
MIADKASTFNATGYTRLFARAKGLCAGKRGLRRGVSLTLGPGSGICGSVRRSGKGQRQGMGAERC